MDRFLLQDKSLEIQSNSESQDQSQRVQQSQKSSLNARSSHKNKYINKIRDLGVQKKNNRQSLTVISNDKKQRNKISAKQSRDRKKLYIQILQEKQKNLTKILESRKKQLQQTQGYLQRVINQNKTMNTFTASRHQLMKKIQNLLQLSKNGGNHGKQLNQIIDSLRSKIGATGCERMNTINEYFRQIVNLSLPALHRYMMWSASQGRHFFGNGQEEDDDWFVELRDAINLSQQQRRQIKGKQQFLKEQKVLLQKLIGDLKQIKNDIQQKSVELEQMINAIREILTPIQSAYFVLFIQKNKYRKQLNLCEATLEQNEPQCRKIIKQK